MQKSELVRYMHKKNSNFILAIDYQTIKMTNMCHRSHGILLALNKTQFAHYEISIYGYVNQSVTYETNIFTFINRMTIKNNLRAGIGSLFLLALISSAIATYYI